MAYSVIDRLLMSKGKFIHIFFEPALLLVISLSVPVYAGSQEPQLILPVGHIGGVREAIFSPDYKHIVTRDRFEVPRIWDTRTGYLLANLPGHADRISCIGYNRDGTMLFTGSRDGTLIIWDAKKALPLVKLGVIKDGITSGAFNKQGTLFISGSGDKSARIWDISTGKLLLVLGKGEHESEVSSVQFNQNGDIVRTISYPGRHYWNTKTGMLLAKTVYNDSLDRFVITKLTTKDTSFLSGESGQWDFTPVLPNPGRKLVYDIYRNDVLVTDSLGKKIFTTLNGHTYMTRLLYYSPKGDTIYMEPDDRLFATAWAANTMQLKKTIAYKGITRPNVHRGDANKNIIFNWDRSYSVVVQDVNSINDFNVWGNKKGSRLSQFRGNKKLPQKIQNAFFSRDNTLLMTTMYNDREPAIIWDMATGKIVTKLPYNKEERITHGCFSNDKTLAAIFGADGHISIFDIGKNILVSTITTGTGDGINDIIGGEISPDNSMICFNDGWAAFKVYDIHSKKEIWSLREPGNYVRAAAFAPDNKRMLLSTTASLVKMVDLKTKKILYHFFPVDSTEYFTQVPAGYYQASPGATKLLHYVTKDLKVITFEQLDIKYNRPDKVLETIGSNDKALINAYRKAYQKRLKKLGVDTAYFRDGYSVPECDFVNRDAIESEQNQEKLMLHIKGRDSTYLLGRFNVWVNEVPVFGLKGISLLRRNSLSFDTTITIKLSQGENRIETSISNVNGTESYRMPLTVNYLPAVKQKESVRFIGIGIDKFSESKYNLQYSVKDIRDLSKKLKEKYKGNIIIDTLFNENVTINTVKALKQKLLQTTENDKVIVAYSGHGMLSKEYDYYLSTYAVNFEMPEQNGLPYDELENLLDSIPARKKLMLIDACHSGEVDKEDLVTLATTSDSLIKGFKPVAYKKDEKHLGLRNSFELMQSLFVNVGKSTGATIISAAAGTQFALERNDLKNGVFTYSIMEAMSSHPSMKISELKNIVGKRVEELTKGLQKPTSRNETIAVDWNVW
ncbi:MAG TPA: caspase family protein [Chitinophagaceae bacterium]|nr:caspase family protein [Chitinophagaceae bacterium]